MIVVEWPEEQRTDWRAITENIQAALNTRDATILQLQAEIARLRETLTEIRDGTGKCETCGTVCVGEGGGVTACDCSRPTWTEQDPTEIARAALGGSND